MGKFVGPGYVRLGPVTAGAFGVGCLLPILLTITAGLVVKGLNR